MITSEINPKKFHFLNARLPEISLTEVNPTFPSPLTTLADFLDHLGCIAAMIIRQCAVVIVSSTRMTLVARSCGTTQSDVQKRNSGSSLATECRLPRNAHKRSPRNWNERHRYLSSHVYHRKTYRPKQILIFFFNFP